MTNLPVQNASRGHFTSQLVVSIISILFSLSGFFGLLVLLLLMPVIGPLPSPETGQLQGMLWIMLLLVLLPIPSLVLSIRALNGRPGTLPHPRRFLVASILLFLVPILLLLGNWLVNTSLSGWLMAPVNILLVLLPLFWFVELGRRRLSAGDTRRHWGLSIFSIYLTLPAIIAIEMLVGIISLVFAGIWLIQQPEFAPLLRQLEAPLQLDPMDLQIPDVDLLPLVQRPGVIAAVLLGVSLIVPLIEEALKPAALWILHKRALTPVEGFAAGLICGAAFALIESVFSLSSAVGSDWLFTALGRVGTGLLHTLTAGLNGWALAASWQDGKPLRVAWVYILAVVIHGVWNFFALFMGVDRVSAEIQLPVNPFLSASSVWVLTAMSLAMLVTLFLVNRRLRRNTAPPPLLSIPPFPPEIPPIIG